MQGILSEEDKVELEAKAGLLHNNNNVKTMASKIIIAIDTVRFLEVDVIHINKIHIYELQKIQTYMHEFDASDFRNLKFLDV